MFIWVETSQELALHVQHFSSSSSSSSFFLAFFLSSSSSFFFFRPEVEHYSTSNSQSRGLDEWCDLQKVLRVAPQLFL